MAISKNTTPGTENNVENASEYQLKPTESGMKHESVLTAHKAPTPPKALVKKDLKKLPLFLKIKKESKTRTEAAA